jgi:predicted transposase/invertase (TIGR01784 family)
MQNDERKFYFPKNDHIAKLLLSNTESKDVLEYFLSVILKAPMDEFQDMQILNPHLIPEYAGEKEFIVDVLIRTKSGTRVHVEIQVNPQASFLDRVCAYGARLFGGQLKAGETYQELEKVICIVIADFNLFSTPGYYDCFMPQSILGTGNRLSEKLEYHTLELPKVPLNPDGDPKWDIMTFFNADTVEKLEAIARKNKHIARAVEVIKMFNADDEIRYAADLAEKVKLRRLAEVQWGELRGIAIGKEEGLAIGKEEGLAIGEARGKEQQKTETIINMFETNLPVDLIAKIVRLSIDEVAHVSEKYTGTSL